MAAYDPAFKSVMPANVFHRGNGRCHAVWRRALRPATAPVLPADDRCIFVDHLRDGLEVITATRATGAENERHALATGTRPDSHAVAVDELLAIGGHRQQLKHSVPVTSSSGGKVVVLL